MAVNTPKELVHNCGFFPRISTIYVHSLCLSSSHQTVANTDELTTNLNTGKKVKIKLHDLLSWKRQFSRLI